MDEYELAELAEQEVDPQAFELQGWRRLRLFIYLVPLFGIIPSIWSLQKAKQNYEAHNGRPPNLRSRREQQISRLSITLTLAWLILMAGLLGSSNLTELSGASVKLAASTLTSSYFLTCFWMMVQLWRRQRLWFPGLSNLSDRLP
jgi:hypothetical protein